MSSGLKWQRKEADEFGYDLRKTAIVDNDPVAAQKRLPLGDLVRIVEKPGCEGYRHALGQGCLSSSEGSPDCLNQCVTVELKEPREGPQVEEVFHSAVCHV